MDTACGNGLQSERTADSFGGANAGRAHPTPKQNAARGSNGCQLSHALGTTANASFWSLRKRCLDDGHGCHDSRHRSCRRAGSSVILLKDDLTLLTTILARLRGSIHAGSSTSVCTARTRRMGQFNNSRSRNSGPYRADGKCGSPTPPVCTSWTTTPRLRHGTTRVCHHHWIRTSRSTSVTSGVS